MMTAFLNLTKPRISVLFAITGLTAMIIEGSAPSAQLWLVTLAIFLVGGSANALNQYFEREVDVKMARTAKKRPLPLKLITPGAALIFAAVLAIAGNAILYLYGTWLAVAFGVGTILFYSFYYTLWLKPRTPYNIVIGGAAGATGPLIGWAAATGEVSWVSFILFLIVFFWTPPHFWALAICCKDDYANVGYPMLPLVKGDDETRRQILLYSFTLLPLGASLYFMGAMGKIYFTSQLVLNVLFVAGAFKLYRAKSNRVSWQFFGYSIFYLLALFGFMIADVIILR